ncbi:HlyD family secretion protein [Burkholderia sp. FERM BP-3421]|uniref:HlyD family secretion protein n=1 Tax=Burkholderia sp. FERM BP-3421 TaxID=1494466 RepID=UPI002360670B|nr:HlyD family secretion protein [Burkholderia sp. FERM BP-3421]WDD95213.1 HlyD family secretion protein [Burkholderia sp. FERM BP-3421]
MSSPAPESNPKANSKDSDTSTAARPSRRRLLIAAGIVALVVGGVWLARWWTVGRFIESTDDAYLQADSMTAAPKIAGYITDVYVADNQPVKVGDPLVRLDTRQYQVSLDQALATVDARRADIARAEAEIGQQRANLEQAGAQREVARVNARHAGDEVARYAPLVATGAETAERVASLTSTRDQARATLAANSAALDAARTQIASSTAALTQARAQLEAALANAAQARLDLDNTIVRSTLAGRVGDRTVRVGQYVQPGTRLLTVVPVERTYLVANFKETQVGRMRAGQPVELRVDALPGKTLHGVVDSFAPGTGAQFALLPPENATGNFTKIVQRVPVRIRLDTGAATRAVLVPGLSVTVDVDTRGARDDDARIDAENRRD